MKKFYLLFFLLGVLLCGYCTQCYAKESDYSQLLGCGRFVPGENISVELNSLDYKLDLSPSTYKMYPDSFMPRHTQMNSQHLQTVINAVSNAGGGTVTIPSGNYYFYPMQKNFDTAECLLTSADINYVEYHVIKCRDNVSINGTLLDNGDVGTTLLPIFNSIYPVDMFYFADIIDKTPNKFDKANVKWLNNADFNNMIVDFKHTKNTGHYNAKGKGFYIVLLKDCDWNNVTITNTEGTGLGVDCPVNCTIKNCTAIACGKQATTQSVGASGFGIGFGYSEEESMLIENCTSICNRKFGIFFENQARFEPYYQAKTSKGFVVKNCVARGNKYNFGGEMCLNTHFIDCIGEDVKDTDPNPLNIMNEATYYFGTNSRDYHIYQNGKEISVYHANK